MHSDTRSEASPRPIQPAATVLLVRDSNQGPELFMLERPARGAFPGLHVFPGGKVDSEDADLAQRLDIEPPTRAVRGLEQPLPFLLAAVRECFEETGVLLASRAGAWFGASHTASLHARRAEDFEQVCLADGARLELAALRYFAHWITPEMAPRRFDTRFFIAALPPGQEARHAPVETESGEWVTPAGALERAQAGEWTLIMPTRTSLESLLPYASVDALLAGVERGVHLPPYTELLRSEGLQSDSYPEGL